MLILTRKVNEEVILTLPSGEEIVVLVTQLGDGRVSLGFSAPKTVVIHRREIYGRYRNRTLE